MRLVKSIKRRLWRILAPVWPPLRDFLLKLGIIWHEPGRQRFHIGWLREDRAPEDLMAYLQSVGFYDHSLAWKDDDELWGIRKEAKGSEGSEDFQYHIRLFKDREVRGHYEYTTEANWYKHFWEIGMEDRKKDFLDMLGDWISGDK